MFSWITHFFTSDRLEWPLRIGALPWLLNSAESLLLFMLSLTSMRFQVRAILIFLVRLALWLGAACCRFQVVIHQAPGVMTMAVWRCRCQSHDTSSITGSDGGPPGLHHSLPAIRQLVKYSLTRHQLMPSRRRDPPMAHPFTTRHDTRFGPVLVVEAGDRCLDIHDRLGHASIIPDRAWAHSAALVFRSGGVQPR